MFSKKMGDEWMEEALEIHVEDLMEEISSKPPKHVLAQGRIYYQEPDGDYIYDKVGEFRADDAQQLILRSVLFDGSLKEMLNSLGKAAADPLLTTGMGLPKAARVVAISLSIETLFTGNAKLEDGKMVSGLPSVLVAVRNEDGDKRFAVFPLAMDADGRKNRPPDDLEPPQDFTDFVADVQSRNPDPLSAFFGGLAEGGTPTNMKVTKAWEEKK